MRESMNPDLTNAEKPNTSDLPYQLHVGSSMTSRARASRQQAHLQRLHARCCRMTRVCTSIKIRHNIIKYILQDEEDHKRRSGGISLARIFAKLLVLPHYMFRACLLLPSQKGCPYDGT